MEKLQAQIIIEILGRPPEHVEEALNTLISRMASEKGVKVLEKVIHKPVLVKDQKNLYTAFAEITLELDAITNLLGIAFAYLPSNIELIYPERIDFGNADLSSILNRLTQRLHSYDAITKKALADKEILLRRLAEVAPELFKKGAAKKIKSQKTQKDVKKSTAKKSKKVKKTKKKSR